MVALKSPEMEVFKYFYTERGILDSAWVSPGGLDVDIDIDIDIGDRMIIGEKAITVNDHCSLWSRVSPMVQLSSMLVDTQGDNGRRKSINGSVPGVIECKAGGSKGRGSGSQREIKWSGGGERVQCRVCRHVGLMSEVAQGGGNGL
jgi:hypothetical protein